jgi:hypothetical protein
LQRSTQDKSRFLKGLQNGRQRSKQAARLARPANSAADLFWTIDTRGRFVSLITAVGDLDFCEKNQRQQGNEHRGG